MKISGFTYVRNALLYDFPVVESILSALPICDEFIVVCGDSQDNTTELIKNIDDPKIRIIETVWDIEKYPGGSIHSQQANIGLGECRGDWCLYLQADEVIHEKYLPIISKVCRNYLEDDRVEGFLFSYKHFWGDYEHYQWTRKWYRREIRIVRNNIGVSVWGDAQGFRRNSEKLKVILLPAEIYHYGWVRDPAKMKRKIIAQDRFHHTTDWVARKHPEKTRQKPYQYGTLKHLAKFRGTHPGVMQERIRKKSWSHNENEKPPHPHNKWWVRFISWIENNILHTRIGEYRNYKLIGRFKP